MTDSTALLSCRTGGFWLGTGPRHSTFVAQAKPTRTEQKALTAVGACPPGLTPVG
ncbi:hypothetical protein [Streptomyces sp. NBC_01594]|uniref:hypothetical protein n=1 Tax=Streptomyces sp. NBC_01594 TaxID=2975890 RepID=UPI003866834E